MKGKRNRSELGGLVLARYVEIHCCIQELDLDKLPSFVELPDAPSSVHGCRKSVQESPSS
jgi:hypothetical protein